MDGNREPMGKVPRMGEQDCVDAVPLNDSQLSVGVMLAMVGPEQHGNV